MIEHVLMTVDTRRLTDDGDPWERAYLPYEDEPVRLATARGDPRLSALPSRALDGLGVLALRARTEKRYEHLDPQRRPWTPFDRLVAAERQRRARCVRARPWPVVQEGRRREEQERRHEEVRRRLWASVRQPVTDFSLVRVDRSLAEAERMLRKGAS